MNIRFGTNQEINLNQSRHAYGRSLNFRSDTPVKGYYHVIEITRDETSPIKNAAEATVIWVASLEEHFLSNSPLKIQLSYLYNFSSTSHYKTCELEHLLGKILVINSIEKGQSIFQGKVYHPYLINWEVIIVDRYDEDAQDALNDLLLEEYGANGDFDSSDFIDNDEPEY